MNGLDLRVERVKADVAAQDIAREMGVSKGRVSQIEASRVVTAETQRRYLDALHTCITKSTAAEEGRSVA